MILIFAEVYLSDVTLKKWTAEFKRGRDSTERRPKTTADKQVDAIHCMVLVNRRLTVQKIAKFIGLNSYSFHSALTEILRLSNMSARWILRMLTTEPKD